MSDDQSSVVDEAYMNTLEWEDTDPPDFDQILQGSAFVAGWAVANVGATLHHYDEFTTSHTIGVPKDRMDQVRAIAAQCGYACEVVDEGRSFYVKVRLVRPEKDSLGQGGESFKERMEAKACPECGSWAVASQVTLGSGERPVRHCQACEHIWPLPGDVPLSSLGDEKVPD
jgi:hypothetical protein